MKHFIVGLLFFFLVPFGVVHAEKATPVGDALVTPVVSDGSDDPIFEVDTSGGQFYVPAGETVSGNVYKVAKEIVVDGTIDGDLIAAAEEVTIHGTVNGDALVLAERVHIDGAVSGSVRAIANDIEITSKVGGNVTVAASKRLAMSGDVARSLDFYARGCKVAGSVGGSVHGAGRTCSMNGSVASGVWYQGNLAVGDGARIGEELTVWGQEPTIAEGAEVKGDVVVHSPKAEEPKDLHSYVGSIFWKIVWLLGMLAVGFLLAFLMPKLLTQAAADAKARIGLHFGVGALVLVLTPMAAVLLAVTTIGIPLALILGVSYPIVWYVGKVIGACILGFWVLERIQKKGAVKPVAAVTLGVILFKILTWVPFLGFWVSLAALLVGVGSLSLFKAREIKRLQDT